MLGLYVSDHPLMGAEARCGARIDCTHRRAARARRRRDRDRRRRRHRPAAEVHEEGRPDGHVRARGPRGRDRGDGVPEDDARVRATSSPTTPSSCVKGRVDGRDDRPSSCAMEVTVLEAVERRPRRRCESVSARRSPSEELIDNLKRLLVEHPGDVAGVPAPRRGQVLRLSDAVPRRRRQRPRGRARGCFWARTRSSPEHATWRSTLVTADGRDPGAEMAQWDLHHDDPGAG